MEEITKDNRFSHIVKDPRFRRIPKQEKKVKIDKRFQSMFNDKRFKVKYTVDKRGRLVDHTSSEDLKRYYAVSSDESDSSQSDSDQEREVVKNIPKNETCLNDKTVVRQNKNVLKTESDIAENKTRLKLIKGVREDDDDEVEEEEEESENDHEDEDQNDLMTDKIKEKLRDMKVDYARGEAVLLSDSSSDEESIESDDEEELEHGWGELDHDAENTDMATNRLAVCNMDWDKIRATDLMVLFNSFLPTGGIIHSVTIYPSEFGLQRMKEEEIKGPVELTETAVSSEFGEIHENEEENEEGSKFHMEKLRQYQLNRLKYFYAIVVCDSTATSEKIYNECDGLEYESSATKLDLRFVPDDTVFDQEVRESCEALPDLSKYRPRYFTTTALQQAKVELTWDETNPEREELTKKLMSGQVDGVTDADLHAYLASTSCEESDGDQDVASEKDDTASLGKGDALSRYKALIEEIKTNEQNKKSHDVEMEVTWGLGLKDKTEKLVKKKLQDSKNLTPFQQFLEKRKEKKKQKRKDNKQHLSKEEGDVSGSEISDDYIPSDIDMNDPYFKEELEGMPKSKKNNKHETKEHESDIEDIKRKKAELELLLMGESDTKHFSLKSIQEKESEKKKKKKKKNKTEDETPPEKDDDFQMNVNDERFSALFSSHHFNVDPTDPHYKRTKGMEILKSEKLKRRNYNESRDTSNEVPVKVQKKELDPELSVLVKSVKRKAKTLITGTTG